MNIVRVSKYQTSDGKLFDDDVQARHHENTLEASKELEAILKPSINTGRLDAILKHLLYDEENVRAILLRYHKRLPKGVKAA